MCNTAETALQTCLCLHEDSLLQTLSHRALTHLFLLKTKNRFVFCLTQLQGKLLIFSESNI